MGPVYRSASYRPPATHFTTDDPYWSRESRPACGQTARYSYVGYLTDDPYRVDCGSCKRTTAYKDEKKARKGDQS